MTTVFDLDLDQVAAALHPAVVAGQHPEVQLGEVSVPAVHVLGDLLGASHVAYVYAGAPPSVIEVAEVVVGGVRFSCCSGYRPATAEECEAFRRGQSAVAIRHPDRPRRLGVVA